MYFPHFADLNFWEILSKSWSVFKAKVGYFVMISIVYYAIAYVPTIALSLFDLPQNNAQLDEFISARLLGFLSTFAVYFLGSMLVWILVYNVYTILVEDQIGEKQATIKDMLLRGVRAMPTVIGIGLVFFGAVIGIFILMVLFRAAFLILIALFPMIWLTLLYTFSFQAAILRGKNVFDSLKFSKAIVTDNWWETFGNLFALGLVINLPLYCATSIIFFGDIEAIRTVTTITSIYGALFGFPIQLIGSIVIYLKLESRYQIAQLDQGSASDYRVELRDRIARANAAEMGLEEIAPPSNGQDEGQDDTEGD